ncbi:MAG: Prolyl oligopeptidase [Actinobacteria bacterium]|nr:Prolyl oligopeptidase [Actinomycetota bacterium]
MAEPGAEQRAREVADRYWDHLLELEPIVATQVGDERFDDRLPDPSDEGIARRASVLESAVADVARIDRTGLGTDARTTLDVLDAIARQGLEAIEYRLDRLQAVSHLLGPGQLLAELASLQRADTPERAANYARRLRAIPTYLERVGATARGGVATGMIAPALVVDRTIGQVQRLLATPPEESPGMAPLPADSPRPRGRRGDPPRRGLAGLPQVPGRPHRVPAPRPGGQRRPVRAAPWRRDLRKPDPGTHHPSPHRRGGPCHGPQRARGGAGGDPGRGREAGVPRRRVGTGGLRRHRP